MGQMAFMEEKTVNDLTKMAQMAKLAFREEKAGNDNTHMMYVGQEGANNLT